MYALHAFWSKRDRPNGTIFKGDIPLLTFSLYQCSLQGELLAEIPVSSSVVYSVAWHCGQPANILSVGGSSSRLDLCTPNFAYKDRTVALPLKG